VLLPHFTSGPYQIDRDGMSYPEPRHIGNTGEQSAWIREEGRPPDIVYATGGQAHYLATGATTDGAYGLYRWNMAAEPTGPAPHFHRTFSEAFFVLEGLVNIYDGEKWVETGSGDFTHVPPGGIHGFRNESGAPASMLILFTPGAPREGYFEGLRDIGAWTPEEKIAFMTAHDNIPVDH
jgi:mannose-6-phosphate isomerase-like protein (cupin superfamily)